MPAATTSDQFVDMLRKSQLVSEERLEATLRSSGTDLTEKPKMLAERLVRQGLLTPFQAGLILNGKWKGFLIAGGKYKLLQLLGIGGMGKVYLCEHIRMKRLVALKVLPLDQLQDKGSLERFNREAVAAAALNHPNIVKAYDLDQDGALHFLVLEYVDGSSLQEVVKKHGPLEINRACHYIAQAAMGLQHAHEAGWVHRDIKPGNLLLDRTGTVKILDMGLARFFQGTNKSQLTEQLDSKPVLGTADYLAPEQAVNSSDVDIRADIYSLGATMYYLLAGKAPFENGSVTEKLLAHQMKDPPSISTLRPELPKPLEAVLKKMMAKKPVHRFQSPAAVVDALQPWTGTPIEPPADEEMPRLCTALESYASGVPAGPISSVGYSSSSRMPQPRNAPHSSSYLLRNGVLNLRWLRSSKRKTWMIGSVIGVGLVAISLFAFWDTIFSDSKLGNVPIYNMANKASPNTPTVAETKSQPSTPSHGAISAADAMKRIDETVVVEFLVNSTGKNPSGSMVFLNSIEYRQPDNFVVVLDLKSLEGGLKRANISDPLRHFDKKTIQVTGKVTQFNNLPQIMVKDLKQIEIVAK